MKKLTSRLILYFGLVLIIVGGLFYYYESHPRIYNTLTESGIELNILDNLGKWEGELPTGQFYSFVNEDGEEIDRTGHEVFIGDEMILENNDRYRVVEVDSDKLIATCQLIGRENISWREEWEQPVLEMAEAAPTVGIYTTHNDESYVPTEGTESVDGEGGIMKVAGVLTDLLKKNNVNADVSNDIHLPHDANAYHRSRKTAVALLKKNPIALIDVHRDGVPDPEFYATEFDGEAATKIRLVVGKQNPHMSANLEFAKQVKGYFDKEVPGLIKGIFMAKGNYNQDLGPKVMLIEVGTHTNSREEAEAGVTQFAEGLPKLIGASAAGGGGGAAPPAEPTNTGAGSSILWLVLAVVVGGGAFLLISTGSFKGSWQRLSNLGREFANYLGPSGRRKKNKE